MNSTQSPDPPTSPLATAMRTRTAGRTTRSLVPASVVSALRTAPGMRVSRTTPRRTTGSVEARIAPRRSRERPAKSQQYDGRGRDYCDCQNRPRAEREGREHPFLAEFLHFQVQRIEKQNQRQGNNRDRFERGVVGVYVDQIEPSGPDQCANSHEDQRKGQR